MTGYHEIRMFRTTLVALNDGGFDLPGNWKPFGSHVIGESVYILCRKWHRGEQEIQTKEYVLPPPTTREYVLPPPTFNYTKWEWVH